MSFRKSQAAFTSLANSFSRLVRLRQRKRSQAKRFARRRLLEQLEPRNLMALNIISMTPADGSVGWALDTNLTMTFDAPVVKGQGSINVVQNSTGTLGVAVDVNSPNVTIAGAVVTVDLPTNLLANQAYTVYIDNGAFLDTTVAPTAGATILTQDFEFMPLQPFPTYTAPAGTYPGDGTDWTPTPPLNYSVDNSLQPADGRAEYRGWTFLDRVSWLTTETTGRDAFTKGSGTVAVADTDKVNDLGVSISGNFNSKFTTRPIKLEGVAANSVVLEFDSSFRPEGDTVANDQIGRLEVTFDADAATPVWTQLFQYDSSNTGSAVTALNVNEHKVVTVPNPAGTGNMKFRFGITGSNDWWWAVDNLKVTSTVTGTPFLGITDSTKWNLDLQVLTVSIDKTSMSENGGTATGTVTRLTNSTAAPLVVTLTNSDSTEATIPATVTIPVGAISATFPIVAVNDALPDRLQSVTFTANAPSFASGSASLNVLDDEGPKIVQVSTVGVDFRGNLKATFNVPVVKGNGLINIFRTSDDRLVSSIPVGSTAVTISGATVTINPPVDLVANTAYYVTVDDGTFVDPTVTAAFKTLVQTTNFNALPLGPFTGGATGGDGTDFTKTPPAGYAVNGVATGGKADFNSWTFVDKSAWVATTGDGGRSGFTSGSGVIAVADASHWAGTGNMDTFITTRPIDLAASNIDASSVSLEFDGIFASGIPTVTTVEVSYNNGVAGSFILLGSIVGDPTNSHYVFNSTSATGANLDTVGVSRLNNPATGQMVFRIGLNLATSGVAAIDNIQVFGGVKAYTFEGISSKTAWAFTTTTAALALTIDKPSILENPATPAGIATGTVSRTVGSDVDITVLLTSDNTGKAIVPTSVVIPKDVGIFTTPVSVTFPITGVDNATKDGDSSTVKITATSVGPPVYVAANANIIVKDDDYPKITTLVPADDSTAVPVSSDLVVTYSENVKKGNGFIHIIRKSDGKSAMDIDVQSSAVTVSGAVVTINPPANLAGLTDYYISIDDGAILDNFTTVTKGTTLLTQDFELMTLGPAVTETSGVTPNGRDFTTTPPSGYAVDNAQMPPGGVPEWNGWSFADKSFWATQGGQSRANFTRGQGTIAVADNDEWDDLPQLNNSFNSFLKTTPINLENVVENTVVLEFDSSFRAEASQLGILDVSYDGGTTWNLLFQLDSTNSSGSGTAPNVNERKVVNVPNPAASPTGSMIFRFNNTGNNNWWWAIDNLKVTSSTTGFGSPGIANSDSTTWNFTTADAQTLSLAAAPTSIAENGGTATITVSRNLGTTGDLVVSLASSDAAIATVPATVTILDGQASATFTVSAVDNALAGGLKNVIVTASTAGFVDGKASVSVTDNEVPNVIVTEIMYRPASGSTRTEWVEVVNRGPDTADLGNWTLDDEDKLNWGKIPAGTLLAPGQVAVIYNGSFGTITDTIFRTQWNVPASALVVGQFWSNLNDDPSAVGTLNENLILKDAGDATIDQANFDDDGVIWPAGSSGASIYLKDPSFNNNDGTNWALSTVGTDGVINALGAPFATTDRGSPGVLSTATATIATRGLFYNNATGTDALASLATDKTALLPGQSSTFANYTNYSRGLNGVVIDIAGLPATTTDAQMAASLQFANWNGIDAAGFVALPATAIPTVTVVPGGTGAGGSTRVRITFPDNTLQNTWLQVKVLANARTGLLANDVFYFGNVIADVNVGNLTDRIRVNANDTSAVRNNQATGADAAGVTNIYDLNRDGRVNAQDTSIVRNNQQTGGLVAPITAPAARGGNSFGRSISTGTNGETTTDSVTTSSGKVLVAATTGAPAIVGATTKPVEFNNIPVVPTTENVAKSNVQPSTPVFDAGTQESKPVLGEKLVVSKDSSSTKLESLDEFFASLWRNV